MAKTATHGVSVDDANHELYIRNAELAVRNKTLSLLQSMSDVTVRALSTDEMVREIVLAIDGEFSYPFVAIGLCDAQAHALHWKSLACTKTKDTPFPRVEKITPVSLASRSNICANAIRTGRRRVAHELRDVFLLDASDEDIERYVKESKIKSILILPLIFEGNSIGVLAIGMDRPGKGLTRYERETFQPLLGLITIAIKKAETYGHLQRTTKQLRAANRHLHELDEMKTEFLSIASHQLRTPLAVVKGYIGMLKGGMLGPLAEKQTETLGRMEAGTEQLIMLVNHLLDVSRIEANRLQVRLERVDIGSTLDTLVKFLHAKADEKHLALNFVLPEKIIAANVDPEKVKEVFMNLLDNAIKYTDVGSVTVEVREDGHNVIVTVRDTGHGLTEKDMSHLFEKFVTGSASQKVKTTTGLGLYVCKKLTEAMQGTVTAESAGVEGGSTFTVTFPLVT